MLARFPNAGVLACIRLRTAFFASHRSYCSEDKVSVHAITALHVGALSAIAEKSAQTRKKLRIAYFWMMLFCEGLVRVCDTTPSILQLLPMSAR